MERGIPFLLLTLRLPFPAYAEYLRLVCPLPCLCGETKERIVVHDFFSLLLHPWSSGTTLLRVLGIFVMSRTIVVFANFSTFLRLGAR